VHIRPATVADIPHIMRLERQSATAAHWTDEQYRQLFQSESSPRLLLVVQAAPPRSTGLKSGADAGSGIVGFLIAHHLGPEWELENIVVAPTARRKGLGKQLLNSLLAAARDKNSNSVFLEVRESNSGARTLYEKAGFRQTGRRKSYYTSPLEDAILYRWTLD
jgi:[ribosomal protein S18]-alanine N-acetyltransferase